MWSAWTVPQASSSGEALSLKSRHASPTWRRQRRSASEHCSCSARSHCGTHRLPALRAHWQMCRRPCGRLGHELRDGAASRGRRVVKTKLLRNRSPDLSVGGRERFLAIPNRGQCCGSECINSVKNPNLLRGTFWARIIRPGGPPLRAATTHSAGTTLFTFTGRIRTITPIHGVCFTPSGLLCGLLCGRRA